MFLLGTFSMANGGLLGANKCTYGPSYWCATLPQASECSAVKHCIKAVWEKQAVDEDDDDVCTICKEMVGEARDQLTSNQTMEELREVFDGSCDLIPIGIIAKECKKLADDFVIELVETLASEMNPVTVCTVAGLCNSARVDKLLEQQSQASLSNMGGDCHICRDGANSVKQQLRVTPKSQMEDKLLELCGYAGSYSDACKATVLDEMQNIYMWLTQSFGDGVCDLTGVCSEAFQNVPSTQPQAGKDIQCEFCEKVIQHWLDVYASDASLEEFKMVLDAICDKLDKNRADHCKHIVNDYYIPAFEFIKNEINPHTVCALVGLCGSGGFLQVGPETPITSLLATPQNAIEMIPLQPAIRVAGNEGINSLPRVPLQQSPRGPVALNGPLYMPNSLTVMEKPTCVLCEYVLHEIQKFLTDGQTEEEIRQEVDAICNYMPGSIEKECHEFVNTYAPAIIQMLVEEIDPQQICTMLHLCDQKANILGDDAGLLSLQMSSNCEMCEFALNEVFSVLNDTDNQDMVRNVLDSICYRLPSSIDRTCEAWVDKYTNFIVHMIVNEMTPDEICRAMDMCKDDLPALEVEETLELSKDTGCVLCEYVVTTLDGLLDDKPTEQEIESALESICSILPSTITKECDGFVEKYTELVIQLLTKEISPDQLCQMIGLCSSTGNVVEHGGYEISQDYPTADPMCTLCEYAIKELDDMLEDKQNEAEIKSGLDVLCQQLSLPVKKQCLKMVDEYTDMIIDMFVKEYTPEMICTELSLCVNDDIDSNAIPPLELDYPEPVEEVSATGVGCVMCEFGMKVLDEHLEDGATVDQVERMVQFLCSYLPGTIAEKCEEMVDEYGDRIVHAIVRGQLDPQEVCTNELGLCTPSEVEEETVDAPLGNGCAWGPDYWCKTPFHAEICGVTQYCQDTVWA